MFTVPLVTNDEDVTVDQFWEAVILYHSRPHLVNRRLLGALTVSFLKVKFESTTFKRITELFSYSALIYEIRKLPSISIENIKPELIKSILEPYDKNCKLIQSSVEEFQHCKNGTFVSIRILLPRQSTYKKCIEIAVFDKTENLNIATFFAVVERGENKHFIAPFFPYDIKFVSPGIVNICIDSVEYAETNSADWLVGTLFPKFMKWAKQATHKFDLKTSLALINIDLYSNLYHSLKEKYGKNLVEIWPEKTDPYKFVYEDIAIASYLIALWIDRHKNSKPTFVDLGCGNGLLVHILNQEGYVGYGIDVRKRKIWDHYPTSTKLQVQTLTPSNDCLFPETDWIIGNHSDELTPWIPVLTARSSYKTNFFLLPCCSYEFDGKKFQRKNTSKSQYADYLDYVENICSTCGFLVSRDKLRIPSTKRICLVSQKRNYTPEDYEKIDENISKLINEQNSEENWVENYKPRSDTERVRNCTKINRNIIQSILKQIMQVLLSEENFIINSEGKKWNKGKKESIPYIVKYISYENLKKLKKECGGLQTLIKNHRYLFAIINGSVQFQIPPSFDINNRKHKSKDCWFFNNHPDGCYYRDSDCSFKHQAI